MRLFMTHLGKFSTATDNDVFDIDYRMLDVNGHYRWIRSTDVIFSRTPDGVSWQILGIAQDISYHKQAEREQQDRSLALENLVNDRTRELSYANSLLQQEINERNRIGAELQYRLEFEKQLSTISSYFISLNDFESVQAGVEYGLAAVAHQIGADRSFIYWFDGEGLQLRLKHSWQAPGVPPRDNSPVELLTMPWLMAPMHNGDDVYMPVVDDGLRQATNVEKALSLEGVHWIIFVPMSFVNRPVGFMGIEALRPSQPPKEDILPLLRYVGEVFANAMESKRTEMALHASEEQLRRITDSMLDMIVQIEENGTIEYVSPSCWAMMGYVATVILGSSFYDLVHPDDLEHTRHSIHHIGLVEFRARHANGQYIWVEAVGNLVLRNDKPNAYVIALREITKRKQAERELDELNRLKTDFVSIAAHELRTPLTSIVGFSELLLNRDIELDKQRRYLSLILDQATSLSALIDGLLDISRLEAKRQMELKLTEVDLCDVVSRAAAPFIESTSMHTIDLSGMVACPPVLGDNSRLLQVCKNLIGNAIKYSPRGGVVRIASQVIGGYLQISIQDEGIGMTDDQMAHLFEKFYRADASNIAISGTGLGLSITKLIIELHNGKIWAQSTYGAGTTFLFTVPLAEHSLDPMSDHMTEGNHAQDTHRG
jgi:PAS domain S-box-containing protein